MAGEPTIHVWITKYALTQGVFEADARHCVSISPKMIALREGVYNTCYHKPDWHTCPIAAKDRVAAMIEARIESLRKSLAKVEKLREKPFSEFVKQRDPRGDNS